MVLCWECIIAICLMWPCMFVIYYIWCQQVLFLSRYCHAMEPRGEEPFGQNACTSWTCNWRCYWQQWLVNPLLRNIFHLSTLPPSLRYTCPPRYMCTTGMEAVIKVWDVRTYKFLHSYPTRKPATAIDISQRGLLAVGKGKCVEVCVLWWCVLWCVYVCVMVCMCVCYGAYVCVLWCVCVCVMVCMYVCYGVYVCMCVLWCVCVCYGVYVLAHRPVISLINCSLLQYQLFFICFFTI